MEKMTGGLIAIIIIAAMQIAAWIIHIDGAVTATLMALIGLIGGSIFGFTVAKTVTKEEGK